MEHLRYFFTDTFILYHPIWNGILSRFSGVQRNIHSGIRILPRARVIVQKLVTTSRFYGEMEKVFFRIYSSVNLRFTLWFVKMRMHARSFRM